MFGVQYTLNRWSWKCFLRKAIIKQDAFQGLLTQNLNKDKACAKDAYPKSPRTHVFLLAMTICGKNVDSLLPRFFSALNLPEFSTFSLLQSSSILYGES